MSRREMLCLMNGRLPSFAESGATQDEERHEASRSRLATMASEQMRPGDGPTEVSGVCTWPEFRGQSLARRLMLHVMAGFRACGERLSLPTHAENAGAVARYRQLGFSERRMITLTVMVPA